MAYNPIDDQYLVVWFGDDTTGSLVDDEFEVFGQRLTATGAQVGANDFRISDAGGTGNVSYDASEPALAFNPTSAQYLVTWTADENYGGLVNEEFEIFGQRLTFTDVVFSNSFE